MFRLLKFKEVARAIPESTYVARAIPEGTTLEQVRVELLGLMADEHSNHHRMGQLYNYVVDKRLAEKAGYKDAREFLSKELADLSQAALSMYGAVAKTFSEPVTRRYGITCLYLLLTYKELADVAVDHKDPGPTLIEVPEDNGQLSSKPFGECSVEQMRKALQRKRKPASSKPLPPEVEVLAEQYREAVTLRLPQGAPVKVALRNHKGTAVLDFKGIPVEQVGELAAALTGPLPPVSKPPQVG